VTVVVAAAVAAVAVAVDDDDDEAAAAPCPPAVAAVVVAAVPISAACYSPSFASKSDPSNRVPFSNNSRPPWILIWLSCWW